MSAPRATPNNDVPFTPDNLTGMAWLLASVVGASIMALGVRELAGVIDSRAVVFFRATLTFIGLLLYFIAVSSARAKLQFSRPWWHLIRGIAIAISTQLGFYAITHMPLVTATVLFFTAPIFATLMAIPVHKEVPGPRRLAAIAVGFAGVLIVLRPDTGQISGPTLAALFSAVLFAFALVISRRVASADGSLSVFTSSVALTSLVSIPIAWPVMTITSAPWPLFVLGIVIVAGALRGFADIQAYRIGEASVLAPIAYTRIVLIGFGAYLFFGEIPEREALLGALVVVGAALYIAQRERAAKAKRRPTQAP